MTCIPPLHTGQSHWSMGRNLKHLTQRRCPDTHSPAPQGPVTHTTTTHAAWDVRFCFAAREQDPQISALLAGYGSLIQQPRYNYTCSSEWAVKYPQYPDKQQTLPDFLDENSWQLFWTGKSQCRVAASPAYAGPSGRELQTTCRCQKDFCEQSWQQFPYAPYCLFLEVKKNQEFFTELKKTKGLHTT